MDLDGGNPVQLTDAHEDYDPSITPDGRTVVYASIAPKGPFAMLWKVPIDGGEPVKLTDALSSRPVVSPDGKLIAFNYWSGGNSLVGLAIMPIDGGTPKELNFLPDSWHWTADSKGLFYAATTDAYSNLFRMDLPDGKAKQITDFKAEQIFDFDISRDGKNAVFLRGTEDRDVIMINNFN